MYLKDINYTYSSDGQFSNNYKQNFLVIVTLQAGAGDINYNEVRNQGIDFWNANDHHIGGKQYSLAGKRGNDVRLFHNDVLIAQAFGGSGSLADVVRYHSERIFRYYKDNSGNLKEFVNSGAYLANSYYETYRQAQIGEQLLIPVILHKNDTLRIQFVDNGARTQKYKVEIGVDEETGEILYDTLTDPIRNGYANIKSVIYKGGLVDKIIPINAIP